jgi:hypothetical protein
MKTSPGSGWHPGPGSFSSRVNHFTETGKSNKKQPKWLKNDNEMTHFHKKHSEYVLAGNLQKACKIIKETFYES